MNNLFYYLPAALLSMAGFFAAIFVIKKVKLAKFAYKLINIRLENAEKEIYRLSYALTDCEDAVDALSLRMAELPVEELIARNRREAEYFQGLQNIFNYGVGIAEEVKHESE